jgi:hypothetical protein
MRKRQSLSPRPLRNTKRKRRRECKRRRHVDRTAS